jgi:ABC-type oligopeptide transport system ATPase subunit
MIIGISGYSGSGKDTIGKIIQYLNCYNVGDLTIDEIVKDYNDHEWWLEDQSGWEIKKFAGKLKQIASLLTGIDIVNFEDPEFKKKVMGPEWNVHGMPMTYRQFLQKLGTDGLRDNLHTNVWLNALFADYVPIEESNFFEYPKRKTVFDNPESKLKYPNWIITDVRFINEAKAIKDRGGIIIRVDRPFFKPVNNHPSEIALDNWEFDYKIGNVSDLTSLKFTIQIILEELNILKTQHEST